MILHYACIIRAQLPINSSRRQPLSGALVQWLKWPLALVRLAVELWTYAWEEGRLPGAFAGSVVGVLNQRVLDEDALPGAVGYKNIIRRSES